MLKGLQASGKTTRAKALALEGWKRVNKDDLRDMIDAGKWSPENESFIILMRDVIIVKALVDGHNVVSDDTNLNPLHMSALQEIARKCAAEFKQEFLDVPLEECILRDSLRVRPVGREVIEKTYEKYLKKEIKSSIMPSGEM